MWRSDDKRSKVGLAGENIACQFLIGKGHQIVDRNYKKNWGEIDIVSKHKGLLHFIEVKAADSHETKDSISRETWNIAEKVHPEKLKRMVRTIESYLAENRVPYETNWQIDVITVNFEHKAKKAHVRYIENIVL